MARDPNASYEGKNQRTPISIKQMQEQIKELQTQFKAAQDTITQLNSDLKKYLPLAGGNMTGALINSSYVQAKYFNQTGIPSSSSSSDKSGYWYKFCTLKVGARYGSSAIRATVFAEQDGRAFNSCATIQCRLKQQNEMGAEPGRSIIVFDRYNLDASDFRICITSNTSSETVAEIWIKINYTHRTHYHLIECMYGLVTINSNMALQSSPPSCKYYTDGIDGTT